VAVILRWYGLVGSSDEQLVQLTRLRNGFNLDSSLNVQDIEQPCEALLPKDQKAFAPESMVSTMITISKA
jgi:hypothetical protein